MTKVLLVDDNPSIRETIEFLLSDEGFDVTTAENGQEALDTLKTSPQDVIIMDIMMPVMDGIDFLQHQGRDPLMNHIPVIVATASMDDHRKVKCYPQVADTLKKPFMIADLKKAIESALDTKHKSKVACAVA